MFSLSSTSKNELGEGGKTARVVEKQAFIASQVSILIKWLFISRETSSVEVVKITSMYLKIYSFVGHYKIQL